MEQNILNLSVADYLHIRGIASNSQNRRFLQPPSRPFYLNSRQVFLLKNNLKLNSEDFDADVSYILYSLDKLEYDLNFRRCYWFTFYNHRKFYRALFPDGIFRLIPICK